MTCEPELSPVGKSTIALRSGLLGLLTSAALVWPGQVLAQEEDANAILKSMSDYLAGQKTISASFNSNTEVLTTDLQKIQFDSSGEVLLSRPDKLRASRRGGYADVEMIFDGTSLTFNAKSNKTYATLPASGTVSQLVDRLRSEVGVEVPAGDLLLDDVYAALSADFLDAKYIGEGVIGGVDSHHLAFRNADTDWQLWVEMGPNPAPRKLVITSKSVTGAPQFTIEFTRWKTDAEIAADAFTFQAPVDSKQVELKDLSGLDEVPPGVVVGGN